MAPGDESQSTQTRFWSGPLSGVRGVQIRPAASEVPSSGPPAAPEPAPPITPDTAPGEASVARLSSLPGIQRVASPRVEMFMKRDFLSVEECADLVALIDSQRRPSTIANPNGDHYFRTSETCDLDHKLPAVAALDAKLAEISGIEPQYGEPLQGQRYDIGQEFKAHTDYFEPNQPDYEKYCSVAGQRTWTFMIYLDDVEAGGATRFKVIDKIMQPERGKLLIWNNRRPDKSLNPATLHHAMKVRRGVKHVITRWYREKPWG